MGIFIIRPNDTVKEEEGRKIKSMTYLELLISFLFWILEKSHRVSCRVPGVTMTTCFYRGAFITRWNGSSEIQTQTPRSENNERRLSPHSEMNLKLFFFVLFVSFYRSGDADPLLPLWWRPVISLHRVKTHNTTNQWLRSTNYMKHNFQFRLFFFLIFFYINDFNLLH